MKDVITAIKAQLAVADEIKSDFIKLTTGEGKQILKLLKEQDTRNQYLTEIAEEYEKELKKHNLV